MENKIRVFISYSHQNRSFAEKLVSVLKAYIDVIWDKDLIAGSGFHEQIKDSIASAHVFMPLITNESSERGWVHQEIGYAMALNIPILPVTTENLDPGGMLQLLHAVKLDEKAENLEQLLNHYTFRTLLRNSNTIPLYQCAHMPEERTRMIIEYANKISGMDKFGLVRQKGGLNSFHIPGECILKPVWTERYFPDEKSEYHKRLQRNERLALEKHAEKEGCKLIITPDYAIRNRHKRSATARIETLISFLNKADSKTVVAFQNKELEKQSLTIVGDWFLAESVSFKTGDGFTNTFFTRDTAEIARRIEDFECELQDLLEQSGWKVENSCSMAIDELNSILKEL